MATGAEMAELEGEDSTELSWGFTTLRMETNWVQLLLRERLPLATPQADERRAGPLVDPLQALCRSLRLAPTSYRRFEWAPAQLGAPLQVETDIFDSRDRDYFASSPHSRVTCSKSAAKLAAALRPFANAEGITVDVMLEDQVVVLSRNSSEPAC